MLATTPPCSFRHFFLLARRIELLLMSSAGTGNLSGYVLVGLSEILVVQDGRAASVLGSEFLLVQVVSPCYASHYGQSPSISGYGGFPVCLATPGKRRGLSAPSRQWPCSPTYSLHRIAQGMPQGPHLLTPCARPWAFAPSDAEVSPSTRGCFKLTRALARIWGLCHTICATLWRLSIRPEKKPHGVSTEGCDAIAMLLKQRASV